jgi:transposase InsO family protein
LTLSEAADRLGLSVRTLRRWVARRRRQPGRSDRGRPAQRSDREWRHRALALIGLLGPGVGVPTLQALCPGMARREVADLLYRYRRACRRRSGLLTRSLFWTRPGSVWAIDFAEPPQPVEGRYGYLLAVRDLASGAQLLWLPVEEESARIASDALVALCHAQGAPLVLKSDNGSAFIAAEFGAVLAGWGIEQLFSPPRTPRYNGSCEAGVGSMKTRSHHQAAGAGRPGQWTCDDAEAARQEANETARPQGVNGPTPEESWRERPSITPETRAAFAATLQDERRQARQEQGYAPDEPLDRTAQAAVDRVALQRALVAHDLLRITARRHE